MRSHFLTRIYNYRIYFLYSSWKYFTLQTIRLLAVTFMAHSCALWHTGNIMPEAVTLPRCVNSTWSPKAENEVIAQVRQCSVRDWSVAVRALANAEPARRFVTSTWRSWYRLVRKPYTLCERSLIRYACRYFWQTRSEKFPYSLL